MMGKLVLAIVIALSLVLTCAGPGHCTTIYVDAARPDDSGNGLSWGTAKQSIGAAIDVSVSGDEIWVAAGTYGKVTLKAGVAMYGGFSGSENDRNQRDWHTNITTIDSNKSTAVTISDASAGPDTVVDGFRIVNSTIAVSASSASPTIANNTIIGGGISTNGGSVSGNTVTGGGITSGGTVSRNIVERNAGTGITCRGIAAGNTVRNNRDYGLSLTSAVAVDNFIVGNGGGITCFGSAPSTISNNTLVGNAGPAAAVRVYGTSYVRSKATVSNNIIAFNYAGVSSSYSDVTLRNNCMHNPDGANYIGLSAGTGDISVDPRLVAVEYGRVHIEADSPCVDAGSDSDVIAGWPDIDGQNRIAGAHVDIGADESTGESWSSNPVIVRVSPSGNDSADGSSWSSAKKTIQAAIAAASVDGGEVWAASGTYRELVTLRTFVGLYGGFTGSESAREQRDWRQNTTVIDASGVATTPSSSAVAAGGAFVYTTVDGFTLRDNGNYGIVCTYSAPRIANNVITGCRTGVSGDTSSDPTISNCWITGNTGDGIACSSATVANNVVLGNAGSGIWCRGAATIVNNTVVGQTSDSGAAVWLSDAATVSNNLIAFNASGIYWSGSNLPTLHNNCVYNPDGTNYAGILAGTGDISADPQFAALRFGQVHIQPGSPCIDTGYDADVVPGLPDMDGQSRTAGSHVDIGADESDGTAWTVEPSIIRVSRSGNDSNDGGSWSTAKKTIQAGINAVPDDGGEVWVAAGNYDERLNLRPFVYLYGGFAGAEDTRDARDWAANTTVVGSSVIANDCEVKADFGCGFSAIDGFTICDQSAKPSPNVTDAGGIYCGPGCSIAIENNTITNNYGTYGGIYLASASPLISNNTIKDNKGGSTGDGCISGSGSPRIAGNTITGNTSYGINVGGNSPRVSGNYICRNGGGIECSGPSPVIMNNVIGENGGYGVKLSQSYPTSAAIRPLVCNNVIRGHSTGIYYSSTPVTVVNNTIVANGTGISGDNDPSLVANNIIAFGSLGLYYFSGAQDVVFETNCVYNPGGKNYGDWPSPGVSPGVGDINVDPKLAAVAYGRMHLQPDSPCINAGTDAAADTEWQDMDGQPRFQGDYVDIGADESDKTTRWDSAPVIVRVSPTGNDANDGSSWDCPKKTVQAGIDAVSDWGGEIWVKGGIYHERISLREYGYLYGGFAGNETQRDQRNWTSNVTTLDGDGGGRVVNMSNGTHYSTIDGFTIRNGAGISCTYTSGAICNNTIVGNNAALDSSTSSLGGGVYCLGASPKISDCVITKNTARLGGGVYSVYGAPVIEDNIISDNSTSADGGGVYLSNTPSRIVSGNIISRNTAVGNGGGLYINGLLTGNSDYITNNTIVGNSSASGGGIYQTSYPTISGNIIAFNSSGLFGNTTYNYKPVLANNDFYNPDGYDYSGVSAGTGDISSDPLFVDRDRGDYHITANSPCIDSGSNSAVGIPALDIDGQTRVRGGVIDMGADEFWPAVSDAKETPDGSSIEMSGPVVTASFPDFLYVESLDRASGIRVDRADHGVAAGARVDVAGTLQTNPDGEHFIAASSVTQIGTGGVTPLALNNSWLGGGPFGYQAGVWGWQLVRDADGKYHRTWGPASGLNNIGLLVRTCGRVLTDRTTGDSFTIDDGSDIGIECVVPSGVVIDAGWIYVGVTGVCSCEKVNVDGHDELHPVIRVRSQSDICAF